jgi:hypothetical protein
MAACTHRACGRVFSGLTAFDRHLRWHKGPPWVSCREPSDVGLVWSDAREGWSTKTGRLAGPESFGVRPGTKQGKSPDSANCSASRGIGRPA